MVLHVQVLRISILTKEKNMSRGMVEDMADIWNLNIIIQNIALLDFLVKAYRKIQWKSMIYRIIQIKLLLVIV